MGADAGVVPARTMVDRIPIVGWWFLRREGDAHGRWFWIRPMLIELGCGLELAWFYGWKMGHQPLLFAWLPLDTPVTWPSTIRQVRAQFVAQAVLIFLMLMATFIDIDEQTVPDAITIPGTLVALLLAAVCPQSMLPRWVQQVQPPAGAWIVRPIVEFRPLAFDFPNDGPAALGIISLVIALAIYLGWCFALLPRRWRMGVSAGKLGG